MGNTSIQQFKENRNNYLKKEDELKYQAALAAFKKKGGKIKKDKPGPTFKSFFKGYKHKKGPRQAEELELTEVELDEGSSDTTDMYALMVKGMKAVPGSPKQKGVFGVGTRRSVKLELRAAGHPVFPDPLPCRRTYTVK